MVQTTGVGRRNWRTTRVRGCMICAALRLGCGRTFSRRWDADLRQPAPKRSVSTVNPKDLLRRKSITSRDFHGAPVVTIGGGTKNCRAADLASDFGDDYRHMCRSGFSSYRDLPVLMKPMELRVRWELRTKLFCARWNFTAGRTHGACDATGSDGRDAANAGHYTDFAVNDAAIPVIPGAKSDAEKFCRRRYYVSIEA